MSMPAVPASAEAESVAIGRDRLAWSSEGEVADPESTSPNRLDGELSKLGSLVGDGVVEKFMSMTRTPGGAGQAPAPAESSDDDGSLEAASARAESLPIEAIDVSRVHERRARGESHSESPATVVPDASKAVASSLASLSAPLRLELPALGSMDAVAHRRDIDRLVTAMASPQAGADRPVASQLHYAFRSWGAGHAVTAQMVLGSLVFQASSPRVGSALAAAMPDGVSNAPWRIEATDATSDEDTARKRRG
ncbi:hypothetical protein [Dyella sp.]|uniref:SpaN/EivJ family type III secretion system needle length determinant n=1 Tax=Dyella sp. TaxID=1869338 RepID=UPI002F947EA5